MSFRSLICAAVLLLAACADSPPIPTSDASTGNDSSTSTDSGMATDATTVMDDGVVLTDGGVDDATSDAPLLSCVDSCGNGDCETRVRLRAQCLQGEAEMSSCTRYVADFACHDAGF